MRVGGREGSGGWWRGVVLGAAAALGGWACSSSGAVGGPGGAGADAGSPAADAGTPSATDAGLGTGGRGGGGGAGGLPVDAAPPHPDAGGGASGAGGGGAPDPDAGLPRPPAHGGGDPSRPAAELLGPCQVELPAAGTISGTAGTLPAPGPYHPCAVLGDHQLRSLRPAAASARVAALSAGGQAIVFDGRSLAPIATFARARGGYTTVALSADGALLAAGAERDGELDLWRVDGHQLVRAVDLGAAWSVSGGPIAFSSDGRRVAAKAGGDLAVVDVATGAVQRLRSVAGGANAGLAFVDGDRKLASVPYGYWAAGATGGSVDLVDLATGAVQELVLHEDIYGPEQLAVSGDGSTMLTRRWGGWVLWDTATGARRAEVAEPNEGAISVLGLDARGTEVNVILTDPRVGGGAGKTWFQRRRALDGALLSESPIALGSGATTLAWSPATQQLLVQMYAPDQNGPLAVSLDVANDRVTARACSHVAVGGAVAFSQDGTRVAAGATGGLMVFDPRTGAAVGPGAHGTGESSFGSSLLSPDGRYLSWTALRDPITAPYLEVRVEDVGGALPRTLAQTTPGGLISRSQVFSGDSRRLASWDASYGVLAVFDVATGETLTSTSVAQPYATLLGFTADGDAVRFAGPGAGAGKIQTVRWRDGAVLSETPGPSSLLAWSADGATLLATGDRGGVEVSSHGTLISTVAGQSHDDSSCFPSPGGSMSPDGSLAAFWTGCGRPWHSATGPLTTITDTATGAIVQSLALEARPVFSWDGQQLALGDTVWCR